MEMVVRVRECEGGRLSFWCPACNCAHVVPVGGSYESTRWEFNGDYLKPTINPSIVVQGRRYVGGPSDDPHDPSLWREVHCHSVICDGRLAFCADSKHALAGQDMPLPAFP